MALIIIIFAALVVQFFAYAMLMGITENVTRDRDTSGLRAASVITVCTMLISAALWGAAIAVANGGL